MIIKLALRRSLFFLFTASLLFAGDHPNIHQRQYYEYSGKSIGYRGRVFSPHRAKAELTETVYGFLPYWTYSWGYLPPRWDLVSTVAYFSLDFDSLGNINNAHGWPVWDLIDEAHFRGVKVDVVATLFDWDGSGVHYLLSRSSSRVNFITQLMNRMAAGDADGVNIDFELPRSGDGALLCDFLSELRDSLDIRLPGSQLSLDIPAVDWRSTFPAHQLAEYCDGLFLMGYDYYWSGSSVTGPVAPLEDPGEYYDLAYSISYYLALGSNVRGKLILGLPLYGQDWPCTGNYRGASTTGTASATFYYEAISDTLGYGHNFDWDAPAPWYVYGSYHQCWYDDTMSLGPKYRYALSEGLQGVGFWALGYDDGEPAFWDQVEGHFATSGTDTADTIIIDDEDPGYSMHSSWTQSTSYGGWEGDYYWTSTSTQGDTAFWRPYIPVTDHWNIYIYYIEGTNRSENSQLMVVRPDTTVIFRIDQTTNGSRWNFLGAHLLPEGNASLVALTDTGCEPDRVVVADALMFVRTGGLVIGTCSPPGTYNLRVYPNPFNGYCNIQCPQYSSLKIFDVTGRVVREWDFSRACIDGYLMWMPDSDLGAGVYYILARSLDRCDSQKVIFLK